MEILFTATPLLFLTLVGHLRDCALASGFSDFSTK